MLTAAGVTSAPVRRIEATKRWASLDLRELWEYRELLYFFIWRDVKVRYKQTALGAAWAVIQPLLTMVVFTLFFGRLARIPSDGLPYPIFTYAALVPWTFFAGAVHQASASVVANSGLIRKVYFPRLFVPAAAIFGGLVDFGIAFLVLLGMMAYFGIVPSSAVLWLPLLVGLAVVTALGVGLWLAALNVQFRDVRYVVPFLIQLWLLATPIAYPSSLVPERYRGLYGLNPIAGVVEGFRWALLRTDTAPGAMISVSAAVALVLCVGGVVYFRHAEKTMADLV